MSFRKAILVLLLAALAACGSGTEPTAVDTTVAPVDEPVAAETDAIEPPADETDETDATDAPDAGLDAVEESVGDDVDEKIVLAAVEPPAETRTDWKYRPNEHFMTLTTAQGTSSAPDKIEVAEVFWYGCSHCYNFDPIIEKWKEDLPADVSFIRLPVMWNPTNEIHARIFYAADALGKLDEMHDDIFSEIHVNKNMLTTEPEIAKLFARYDVSEEDFEAAFRRSPSVEKDISRARNLTKRYGISSVPMLVVNGKYLTSGPGIKNFDDLLGVADELVERERLNR